MTRGQLLALYEDVLGDVPEGVDLDRLAAEVSAVRHARSIHEAQRVIWSWEDSLVCAAAIRLCTWHEDLTVAALRRDDLVRWPPDVQQMEIDLGGAA